jgi:hypothetical protein
MVIVASVYLRFYIEVGVGGGTFLLTPTPPKFLPIPTPQPWWKIPPSANKNVNLHASDFRQVFGHYNLPEL